jgi:hypothetical protein
MGRFAGLSWRVAWLFTQVRHHFQLVAQQLDVEDVRLAAHLGAIDRLAAGAEGSAIFDDLADFAGKFLILTLSPKLKETKTAGCFFLAMKRPPPFFTEPRAVA